MENYKSCVCEARSLHFTHTVRGGCEVTGEASSRAYSESLLAPVSWAGRHPADLEFPLGDGPRCPVSDKNEVHRKGNTNKSLFWVALQVPAFWWLGCEPGLRGDWKDFVGRKATNVSITQASKTTSLLDPLPLWSENHYENTDFFFWVLLFLLLSRASNIRCFEIQMKKPWPTKEITQNQSQ